MSDVKTITDCLTLPHRYPFLYWTVTEVVKGELSAIRTLPSTSPCSPGTSSAAHYAGRADTKLWRRFPEFWPLRQWVHALKMGVIISVG